MSIDPANVEEKFNITVSNSMGGNYKVMFINPLYDPSNKNSVQMWTSENIADNDDAWRVRRRIVGFFSSIWGSNISVEKTFYTVDDVETTSAAEADKIVYTVTLLR